MIIFLITQRITALKNTNNKLKITTKHQNKILIKTHAIKLNRRKVDNEVRAKERMKRKFQKTSQKRPSSKLEG